MITNINKEIDRIRKIWILSLIQETGSFRKTARQCKVTPSAISQTLTSLEKNIGRSLVLRENNKTTISSEGKKIIEEYSPIIKLLSNRFNQSTDARPSFDIKYLDFGTYESLAIRILPDLLRRLKTLFPKIRINTQIARSDELIKCIHNGKLCTAVIAEGPQLSRLSVTEVTWDRLGVFIGKNLNPQWELVKKFGLGTISSTSTYPVYYSRFLRSLSEHSILFKSDSYEALRVLALSGVVPCVLPFSVAKRYKDGLEEIPLKKEIIDKSKHKILLVGPKDCNSEETLFLKNELLHIFQATAVK